MNKCLILWYIISFNWKKKKERKATNHFLCYENKYKLMTNRDTIKLRRHF